jgi:hypothetical protein
MNRRRGQGRLPQGEAYNALTQDVGWANGAMPDSFEETVPHSGELNNQSSKIFFVGIS